MKRIVFLLSWLAGASLMADPAAAPQSSPDTRLFEMRIYYAAPGKLEALNARFRDHTAKLFEKHGMQNIGYWEPLENTENKLIYILAYPDKEAREKSWKAFSSDPEWQKARNASEEGGRLVTKAESIFMKATDYSPAIKPEASSEAKVYELRTYTAAPQRLENLNARFRDHTVKLFSKHGIKNIGYWVPVERPKDTLIYIISHPSKEAAAESFKKFGADPEWMAARKASEEKAGGSLTVPKGVKSEFMKATDYSPMK